MLAPVSSHKPSVQVVHVSCVVVPKQVASYDAQLVVACVHAVHVWASAFNA